MTEQEILNALRSVVREEVASQIQPINQHLERIDARLDSMETRLDRVETRLDSMETRLDRVEARLDSMDERLAAVEEDTKITRGAANSLIAWADQVAVITQVHFPVKRAE